MFQVDLIRTSLDRTAPQFGNLVFDGIPRLVTLELPDLQNKPNISCIPSGAYICRKRSSTKVPLGLKTFEVMNVPGRSDILFHTGNTTKDSEGCILLGLSFGQFNLTPGISRSKEGFNLFAALTNDLNEFELFIRHAK